MAGTSAHPRRLDAQVCQKVLSFPGRSTQPFSFQAYRYHATSQLSWIPGSRNLPAFAESLNLPGISDHVTAQLFRYLGIM
jgi:hypothetical protein